MESGAYGILGVMGYDGYQCGLRQPINHLLFVIYVLISTFLIQFPAEQIEFILRIL